MWCVTYDEYIDFLPVWELRECYHWFLVNLAEFSKACISIVNMAIGTAFSAFFQFIDGAICIAIARAIFANGLASNVNYIPKEYLVCLYQICFTFLTVYNIYILTEPS